MPTGLFIAFGIANLIATIGIAYFASKRGVAQGVQVALAVYGEKIKNLEQEMLRMRERYHDRVAPIVTEHEMALAMIKNKLGLGT